MRKLLLTPSQSGYAAEPGKETLSVALAGGPSRSRRDFLGAVATVNATWNLPPDDFQYMAAFFRTASKSASEPFLIDLILDDFELIEYTAKFVPGSYRLSGVRGLTTTVSAQLEVRPRSVSESDDNSIMDLYEAYGAEQDSIIELLANLVNIDLPDALG